MRNLYRSILTIFLIAANFIIPQSNEIRLDYKTEKLPFGLAQKSILQEPKVALVLSGGGARGISQIGVLRALLEKNIPINSIVGTSMGSIIGGLFSAGYGLNNLDSIVKVIPWDELMSAKNSSSRKDLFVEQKVTEDRALFTLRLEKFKPVIPTSIYTGELLSNYLNLITLNAPIHPADNFKDMKVDFKAVCTDLVSGKAVVLDNGSLSQAMRASSSISLLISPVKLDSMLLADGGLVANIPVKVAKDSGSDFIIAFNATSPLNTYEELTYPWNIADQMVSIPMQILSSQQLKYADIVIEPNLGRKKNTDFTNLDSIILAGYNASIPKMNDIEKSLRNLFIKKVNQKEYFVKNIFYNENAQPFEKPFLIKYSHKDSVSNYEIMEDIYKLYKIGNYESLYVKTEKFGNGTQVKFIAKPNPLIREIVVDGISIFPRSKIDSVLNDLINSPYNGQKILDRLIKVVNLYRILGYSLAEVEETNFDGSSGKLYIRFSEGKISSIEVEGNKKTAYWVIRRELPFDTGELFSYPKVEKGLSNLRSINLFNDITLTIKKDGENRILHFVFDEKPSQLLRFGLRIDNENQTQVSVDVRDENFAKSGTELGLILGGGLRNRTLVLEHKANRIFDTYFTYKVRAFYEFSDAYVYRDDTLFSSKDYERLSTGEYRQIYKGFALGLGTQVERFGNLIFEGRYEWDEVKSKHDYYGDVYKAKIVSFSASTTIDSQDKYPFTEKGVNIKASYETAQKWFGSDLGFTKISFDYKGYLTIYPANTIITKLSFGFADNTLPLGRQFSLGGQNSFFGLRENDYRGRQILLTSFQYRYKLPINIFFDTYCSVRYDLGSIWSERKEIKFKDLRHGFGATVSFATPLGPADFSVGRSYILKGRLSDSSILRGPVYFYFTIGYYY